MTKRSRLVRVDLGPRASAYEHGLLVVTQLRGKADGRQPPSSAITGTSSPFSKAAVQAPDRPKPIGRAQRSPNDERGAWPTSHLSNAVNVLVPQSRQCLGICLRDSGLRCRGRIHWLRERVKLTCYRGRISVIRDCGRSLPCYGAPHDRPADIVAACHATDCGSVAGRTVCTRGTYRGQRLWTHRPDDSHEHQRDDGLWRLPGRAGAGTVGIFRWRPSLPHPRRLQLPLRAHACSRRHPPVCREPDAARGRGL